MAKFTYDSDGFSDLFKDTFGFRPVNHKFYHFETTPIEKQKIYDDLLESFEANQTEIVLRESFADEKFEDRIESALIAGADDRATAIRWIFQGENFSVIDYAYGFGFVQYSLGISSDYREELQIIIDSILEDIRICDGK